MSSENKTPQNLTMSQAAAMVAGALKVAKAAEDRVSKAPKAVSQEEIDKTASLLLEHGWITQDRVENVKKAFADPANLALAIQNIVKKAAEMNGQDPRISAGSKIAPNTDRFRQSTMPTKSAHDEESEADRMYREKIESYRMNGTH